MRPKPSPPFPRQTLTGDTRNGRRDLRRGAIVVFLVAALLLPAGAWAARSGASARPGDRGPRLTSALSGTVETREGERLHLFTDLGKVVIHTQNSGKVDYQVHLETDASQKDAKLLLKSFVITAHVTPDGVTLRGQTSNRQCAGRLWVAFDVNVPKNYSLDVTSGGGGIELDDVNGRVTLSTAGGNITAGNIGGSAHLETDGGHITVKNVEGELVAFTGGGHITTGSISGNASLRTAGGHVRAAAVGGAAHLETGGGNISLERSGTQLVAETSGGEIEVGEASGLVRARTGGGGIRVVRVSGPTNLETVGGSIYLTQVDSAVKASAGAGGITAWFAGPAKLPGMCELESSDGDIVVYLPRQFPVTIDARIQMGDEHRVIVDPAFPLKVFYDNAAGGAKTIRAEGALNGGGEVLRLRAISGNIRLALSDTNKQIQLYKQQMEQLQQQLRTQLQKLEQSQQASDDSSPP
jgi:hypothetical protein